MKTCRLFVAGSVAIIICRLFFVPSYFCFLWGTLAVTFVDTFE